MRCLCGYAHYGNDSWGLEQELEKHPEFVDGDKEFISTNSSMNFKMDEGDYYGNGYENKTIFACPECGTLKIDI